MLLTAAVAQQPKLIPVAEYGRVTLDNYSSKAGLGPVVFDHWLHRSMFTCRVCHVDIGFAMQANATGVRAATNRQGFHCGACHNGKLVLKGQTVFASCSEGAPTKQCARCHGLDRSARKYDYDSFTAKFPKDSYGVDWEETEISGLVKPIDVLEGISIPRPAMKKQDDISITSRVKWASNVIFSHKKHTVWNGCELCHPEIFPPAQQAVVHYTMFQINASQYCGVCHGKVAFPVSNCNGCHRDMQDKATLKNVVVMPTPQKAAGFGGVKFTHKTHVGDRSINCEVCHHEIRPSLPHPEAVQLESQLGSAQACTTCHTHSPQPPVKTGLEAAFHNTAGTSGVCIECHKKENAKNFNNDAEFARALLPHHQAAIDIARAQLVYGKDPEMRELAQELLRSNESEVAQMQTWLKAHDQDNWAPTKCRDCHKKGNAGEAVGK